MAEPQIMIVTGGGRGIGAATARLAAGRGYAVCVNYLRNAEAAAAVDRELGPLTALVNNAGLAGRIDRLDAAPGATIRQVIEVNLLGTIWCARAAVQRMSSRHGGRGGGIVNLSSGAASLGSPGNYVWYAASKGAVDSLTLGLAREVAREGIRVNGVAPGFVKTEIHAASGMPDRLETVAPTMPLGRAAEPEEIAETILWLLSPAASYTTGATLRVGGGR